MKKSEFHRIATIDIGTNGIKFKQYRIDVNKKSKIQQDTFSRVNIRLGDDVFNYGLISENTQKKLFKELSKLIESVKKRKIKWIGICATSAMRSAENGKEICERLASELNVDVRLLSGNEEAYFLKYLNTKKIADLNNYLSIDIGGGSTELHIKHGDEEYLQSVDLGAVRLLQQKDSKEEWDKLDDFLNKIGYLNAEALVGIGGNIRSLLEISGKDKFTSLGYEEFITLQKKLENNSLDDRKKLFNLGDHRADVIVPATKIIERILNKTGIKDLYALNWSLCDAIAFDYYLNNEEAFI